MPEVTAQKTCPRCNQPVTDLIAVDPGLKLRIAEVSGDSVESFSHICDSCFSDISKKLSEGDQRKFNEKNKEQQRRALWDNRIKVLKQANRQMQNKMFSEAAISYERYLKILEVVFEVSPGELAPDILRKKSQNKEITVISSVYWNLLRIYDQSERYKSQQTKVAEKLRLFAQYSPIYPDIIRQAKKFSKKSKNPRVIKDFIKTAQTENPSCFIATTVFQSPIAEEVQTLRLFRDLYLKKYYLGRQMIWFYYKTSPSIALFLKKRPIGAKVIKPFIKIIATKVDQQLKKKSQSHILYFKNGTLKQPRQ